jgi:hypothetical protein
MAGTGFHSVVANNAQICTTDCHEENNLTADSHEKIIAPRIAKVKSQHL